jgi:Ca2+-binding RTX toxin-like protein
MATIVGGVQYALNPAERALAQAALSAAAQGQGLANIIGSTAISPTPGDFNIYDLSPSKGHTVRLAAGGQAAVLYGTENASLVGHAGSEILVGNAGNDKINAAGGSGSIFAGDGANTIELNYPNLAGASQDIFTGRGSDTVRMWGGAVTVTAQRHGSDLVQVHGGDNTVVGASAGLNVSLTGGNATIDTTAKGGNSVSVAGSGGGNIVFDGSKNDSLLVSSSNDTITATGSLKITNTGGNNTFNLSGGNDTITATGHPVINLTGGSNDTITGNATINVGDTASYKLVTSGNDTISFGSGADTIVEKGTATITSGPNGVLVSTGAGTSSVAAGSGSSTLLGGSGADTFIGGSGATSMVGGSLKNTFVGGGGQDTMVANANATANNFKFESTQSGGTHTIENFVHGQDHIALVGYSLPLTPSEVTVANGNTIISLDGGHTTITLVGYTHLTHTDIIH